MATVLNPGQTFMLHLYNVDDTPYIVPVGTTMTWRSNDINCCTVAVIGSIDAMVTALRKGNCTISCEVFEAGASKIMLRESVRVEQPDTLKLVVDDPV